MKIDKIEGISSAYASKLRKAGIRTTERLLKVACTKAGRRAIAEQTSISESMILDWVNRADLMRLRGIGEEYSDLLEHAGVDSVKELRTRKVENLYQKLLEINTAKRLVRRTPSIHQVRRWVTEAKSTKPMVRH